MKSWEEITDCSEFWSVKWTLQTLHGTETRRTVVRGPKGHWYNSFHQQRTTTMWTPCSTLSCSFSIYHALTISREIKFSLMSQNFSKTTLTLLTGAAFVESLLKCIYWPNRTSCYLIYLHSKKTEQCKSHRPQHEISLVFLWISAKVIVFSLPTEGYLHISQTKDYYILHKKSIL